jgi:hypothetical protein
MNDTPITNFLSHDLEDLVELAQHANVYGKRVYRVVKEKQATRLERDRSKLLDVVKWYANASQLERTKDNGFYASEVLKILEIEGS